MAPRRELPPDVAAALDRVPEAGSHFVALPADRQAAWLAWIDGARGRRARAGRIDEMLRRLLPSVAVAEEEVAVPVDPPERYWWLWLLLLLLLMLGLLVWYLLSRSNDKAVVPNVIGLREQQAEIRIHATIFIGRISHQASSGARRGSSRRWTGHHSRSAQGSVESDPCRKKNLLGCYLGLSTRRVLPGLSP